MRAIGREPGERRRERQERGCKDDGHDARRVHLKGEVGALRQTPCLEPGAIVHRDLPLSLLHVDDAEGGEEEGAKEHGKHRGGIALLGSLRQCLAKRAGKRRNDVSEDEQRRAVAQLELGENLADVQEDHGACGEHRGRLNQPSEVEVLNEGAHVQALTHRLHDGKAKGTVALVLLKLSTASLALLLLELLQAREHRGEELRGKRDAESVSGD